MRTPLGPSKSGPAPSRSILAPIIATLALGTAVIAAAAASLFASTAVAVAVTDTNNTPVLVTPVVFAAVTGAMATAAIAVRTAMRRGRTRPGFVGAARAFADLTARGRAYGRGVWAGRAMRVAARLMPRAVGERWLGEAESFLFEAPAYRAKVTRNYLITAPQVIAAGWVAELVRRARRPLGARARRS